MKRSTIVVACAALGLVFGAFGAPLARGAPAKGVVRHACLLQGTARTTDYAATDFTDVVINASGLCAATNFVPAASVTLSLRDSCGADGPGCAAQPLLDRALASVTSVIVGTGAERIGGQIWERLAPGADSYIVRNIKYCEPSAHGNCYPGNKRGLGHLVRHIEATEYACAPSGNCTETYPVEVVLIAGWE